MGSVDFSGFAFGYVCLKMRLGPARLLIMLPQPYRGIWIMNRKQKTVLWIAAIPIIGQFAGRLHVAIQFGAWDIFLSRTVKTLPFYFFVLIIAGILIYAFKDKKPKDEQKQ